MDCFRYIIVNMLHKSDNKGNNYNNNNSNADNIKIVFLVYRSSGLCVIRPGGLR